MRSPIVLAMFFIIFFFIFIIIIIIICLLTNQNLRGLPCMTFKFYMPELFSRATGRTPKKVDSIAPPRTEMFGAGIWLKVQTRNFFVVCILPRRTKKVNTMPWPRPTGSEIIGLFCNLHTMECDVLVLHRTSDVLHIGCT